jgi:hypothetical protein
LKSASISVHQRFACAFCAFLRRVNPALCSYRNPAAGKNLPERGLGLMHFYLRGSLKTKAETLPGEISLLE